MLLGGFLPCLGRFWGFGQFGNLYGTLKAVRKFFFDRCEKMCNFAI